ncbi:hypothetical protein BO99DRAFT_426109 [Aspergillus violaceofuscus CBS 115571]|uniref:Aminoglycoside phosphotransferase domain-containing protein n=1 Tax=Aspergillus violaceofuscus (strain CBS 115571) TaxID=1450538 RepID=A0A2V5HFH0_ASPV1|nr:hypothetical protein BO99DRAFT_426109 [Aspergillus violaceofuscus CBS 115571]
MKYRPVQSLEYPYLAGTLRMQMGDNPVGSEYIIIEEACAYNPAVVALYVWHTDLHTGNIFVHNSKTLTCYPRLIDYSSKVILQAPEDFMHLDPTEKTRIRSLISCLILLYLYEKQIAKELPLLDKVLRWDHGRTRCEPILFRLDFPCPIHFTEEDLRVHAEEDAGWNDVQDFWNIVAGVVSRDGWTPHHLYWDAVALFTELRDLGLKAMVGKERDLFESQTRWVKKL